ncbi:MULTISPECIES: LacI family DNA-binding transcriptional regulator [Arthrobacter]|nr:MULTISPECIES: substrate-binding domain-containing protein [Arthrobacter]
MTVGIMAPAQYSWFSSKVLHGAAEVLRERNYTLSILGPAPMGSAGQQSMPGVHIKHLGGLLLVGTAPSPDETKYVHERGIPAIAVGSRPANIPSVALDRPTAAMTAARHLLALGHRDIALLSGSRSMDDDDAGPLSRSLREVLSSAHPDLRLNVALVAADTVQFGREGFTRLWTAQERKPTAILCTSDELAIGVIFEARSRSVGVPSQLSVVGIDGHDYAAAFGLTTVEQQPHDQGRLAATMILNELEGQAGAIRSADAEHRLIPRESSGRVRG